MRKFTIALSVGALALAGAVAANDDREREPMTRAGAETRANETFTRLDVNADGVLTKADREAGREARVAEYFTRADSDRNGQLSLAEVTASRETRREDRRERFAERRAEHPRGEGQRDDRRWGRGGRHGLHGLTRSADSDGDEQISHAEFNTAALARFDRADADSDGTVTRDERRAAFRGRERHRD